MVKYSYSPEKYRFLISVKALILISLLKFCNTVQTPNFFNFALNTNPTLDPATSGFTISGSATGDYFGYSARSAGDIDGDGYDDIIIGAYGYNSNSGKAYVIYGGATSSFSSWNNINVETATFDPHTNGFTITGGANYYLGSTVSTAGDINKDGYADILIGAQSKNANQGAVFVVYGGPKTTMQNINLGSGPLVPSSNGFTLLGANTANSFGMSLGTAGDVNKDGYADIIIGAYSYSGGRGAAYVIYGGEKTSMKNWNFNAGDVLNPATTGFIIIGAGATDQLGWSVSTAGDVNKDGYADIIVGANIYGSSRGAAYVIYGQDKSPTINWDFSLGASITQFSTGFVIIGPSGNNQLGIAVSTAGDIDNDGFSDIMVAMRTSVGTGAVYVIYGAQKTSLPNWTFNTGVALTPSTTGFLLSGIGANDLFGYSLSPAGDLNKDGYNDIIIGAYQRGSSIGYAYVIYGGPKASMQDMPSGPVSLNPLTNGFSIVGKATGDRLGFSVAIAGDINKDGYKDIIIGAYGRNSMAGEVYVIHTACAPCWSCQQPNCDTCTSSRTSCTTCTNPYRLYQPSCYSTCPDTTFPATTTACQDCLSSNCKHCSDATTCTECVSPYRLFQNQCYLTCPDNSFPATATDCQGCPGNCKHCSDATTCIECTSPYRLFQGQCYLTCPDTSFPATTTACQGCPGNCKHCSDATTCTECTPPNRLYQSQCYSTCPDTTFAPTAISCADCPGNCKHCSDATTCTECVSSYRLFQSQCYLTCPDTSYANSAATCQGCPTDCKHCSDTTTCTECVSPYRLYQSQCYSTCPDITFPATASTCQDCLSTNCKHCSDATTCTGCFSPYLLYQSECILACPFSTIASVGICEDCPSNCFYCSSKDSCDSCSAGYVLVNSACVAFSVKEAQGKASRAISSATQAIGGVVCVGSATFPVTALVSTIVQNTRYLNLTVTMELSEIYKTWNTDLISWDVPNLISDFDEFKESPPLFYRYELGSSFLNNFWPTLVNIAIGLATFVTSFVLKKLLIASDYNQGWAYSLVQKLLMGSFNFTLIQAYACMDNIMFYLVIDAKTNPFNSFFSWTSIISAVVFLAFGSLLVFYNFWTIKKYQDVKRQNPKDLDAFNERNHYWELFYSDFNDEDWLSQSFFAILIMRSTLSSFIVTVLYDYPLMQTSYLIMLDGIMILYLYLKSPFKTLRGKLCQYYFEIITLLVHICTFSLGMQDSTKSPSDLLRTILSTGIIYLNTALVSGSIGFMFIEIYKTISEKERAHRIKDKEKHYENIAIQTASVETWDGQDFLPNTSPGQRFETIPRRKQEAWEVNNHDQTTSFENFQLFSGFKNNGNEVMNDFHQEPSQVQEFSQYTDSSFLPERDERVHRPQKLSSRLGLVRSTARSLRQRRRLAGAENKIHPVYFTDAERNW